MPNYISYPRTSNNNGWKWAFFVLLLLIAIGVAWWILKDGKQNDDTATPTPTVSPSASATPGITTSPKVSPTKSPKATPKVSATPAPDQAQKNATVAQLLFQYTNEERARRNVPALKWNPTLANISNYLSADMVAHSYFGHTDSLGRDPWARAAAYGVVIAAENIAKMGLGNVAGVGLVTDTPESVAQAQFKVWMGSTGHRENIISPNVTELGIGTAFDGSFYISTQIYK
jgi:uncharacterized protein YkwD